MNIYDKLRSISGSDHENN